jgi:hypothetical protein
MKTVTIFIALVLTFGTVSSQALQREKCKLRDVQVKLYENTLPKGYVIVGTGSIIVGKPVNPINELTEKEIKEIKKCGPRFKSCEVYVDINRKLKHKPEATASNLYVIAVLKIKE